MSKHVSLLNTLLIGLIWSVFYLGAGDYLIKQWYQFQILSFTDWKQLVSDFKQGYFQVNSLNSFIFFSILIFFYPLWLFIWYLLRSINLISVFKKRRSSQPHINTPIQNTPKKFTPKKMNMQTGVVFTISPTQTNTTQSASSENTTSQPEINALNDIIKFATPFQAEAFKSIRINDCLLDLSLATDEKALLIVLLNRSNVSWFFDSDQNAPESLWFSEEGHIPSPIYILNQVQDALQAENPTVELKKLIVLTAGSLMDIPESQDICTQHDIQLLQFNNPETPELPTLQSIIETTFDKKEMKNE